MGEQIDMPKELYLKQGWINPELLFTGSGSFVIAIGGRGIGKTYGCLRYLYENHIPFIYMRRTQSQLDSVTIPALNPFNKPAQDMGVNVLCERIGKYTVGFYNGNEQEGKVIASGEPFGIGIALSTFAAVRGLSAEQYEVILFDEIIPERHERPIKEEGLAFANVVESINRNREIDGKKPVKTILLSNSNTMNSQILQVLGVLDILEIMRRKERSYYNSGDIEIFRYIDSPISEKKKGTALYRVIENSDFLRMSIDNEFSLNDYEYIGVRPLGEYSAVVSVGGLTVYRHKSKPEYYIIEGVKSSNIYQKTDRELLAFQKQYMNIFRALYKRRVVFSSPKVKIMWEGMFKL